LRQFAIWIFENQNFSPSLGFKVSKYVTYRISWRSVEPLLSYGDATAFKMAAVRHLGFVVCLDHSRTGGVYHCAKFGWNRCSSFDNLYVLIFKEFGLKMSIQAPNGFFWET